MTQNEYDAAALSQDGIVIDVDAFESCVSHGSTAPLEQAAALRELLHGLCAVQSAGRFAWTTKTAGAPRVL